MSQALSPHRFSFISENNNFSGIKVHDPVTKNKITYAKVDCSGFPLQLDTPYLRINFGPSDLDASAKDKCRIMNDGSFKDNEKYDLTLNLGYEDQRTYDQQKFYELISGIQDVVYQQVVKQGEDGKWGDKMINKPSVVRTSTKINPNNNKPYPQSLVVKLSKYGVFKDQGFFVYRKHDSKKPIRIGDQQEKENYIKSIKGNDAAFLLTGGNISVKEGKVSMTLLITQIAIKPQNVITGCQISGVVIGNNEEDDDDDEQENDNNIITNNGDGDDEDIDENEEEVEKVTNKINNVNISNQTNAIQESDDDNDQQEKSTEENLKLSEKPKVVNKPKGRGKKQT